MLFQIEFNDSVDMPENLNYYFETLEDAKEKDKQYIQNKYEAILSHIEEIDGLLNENATGWKTTRMNKVDLKKHFKYMFPKFRSYHRNSSLLS